MEVERRRHLDGQRERFGQIGDRPGEDDLPPERPHRQVDAGELADPSRPGARRADDGAGPHKPGARPDTGDLVAVPFDADDLDPRADHRPVPAGRPCVPLDRGIRSGLGVLRRPQRRDHAVGLDQRRIPPGFGGFDESAVDTVRILQLDAALELR